MEVRAVAPRTFDISHHKGAAPVEITPGTLKLEWDLEQGSLLASGIPAAILWLPSSLASFLMSLHRALGDERYPYVLQGEGRNSAEDDARFVQSFESFEEGLRELAGLFAVAGWGRLELMRYDQDEKQAVIRIHDAWEAICQKALGVSWGTHYFAGKLSGVFSRHFGVDCWATQRAFAAGGDDYDEIEIAPSAIDVKEEIARIEREEAARREALEVLVEQRTLALRSAVKEIEEAHVSLREQAAAIQELSTPVVQLWDGILMAPLVGYIDDRRAELLSERLLGAITERRAEIVLLDITGVSRMDAAVANHLVRIVHAARLLGARAVLVGISPAIAGTLVALGVDLGAIDTSADLQRGLARAFQYIGQRVEDERA
jgi:rsbT co-antagonist protein RsbR